MSLVIFAQSGKEDRMLKNERSYLPKGATRVDFTPFDAKHGDADAGTPRKADQSEEGMSKHAPT